MGSIFGCDKFSKEKLGNLVKFKKAGNLSKSDLSKIGKPCILYGELYTTYDEIAYEIKSKTRNNELVLSKSGDVILAKSGETPEDISSSTCILVDNVAYGGDLIVMEPLEKIDGRYLSYVIKNKKKKEIARIAQGKSVVHISEDTISNIEIEYPGMEEQERIVSLLSQLDLTILNIKTELSSLINQKKSLSKKIFSQDIKFKDCAGKEYPNWSMIKFSDFLNEVVEKTDDNNSDYLLSSTKTGIYKASEYFDENKERNTEGYKVLRENQLVLSPQNLWMGNINFNEKYKIGYVSPSYKIFNIDNSIILSDYFKQIYKTKRMLYNYELSSEQGASIVRKNLNMDLFYGIEILCPNLEEQKRIADFLSEYDEIISVKQKQLNALKKIKKGFLQQMLPN